MKIFSIIVFAIISQSLIPAIAQTENIDSLITKVSLCQKERVNNVFTEKRDSAFTKFDLEIHKLFKHESFCKKTSDSVNRFFVTDKLNDKIEGKNLAYLFMNNIVVSNSLDGKLRTFSWDDLDGGSSHSYTNFIQVQTDSDKCLITQIDTAQFSIEVGYYQIKQFRGNGSHFYLLTGYGTYGSGNHHWLVKIFEIKNDLLVECINCYPDDHNLLIGSRRSQNIDLKIDEKNNEISYKKYGFDYEMGYFSDENDLIRLKLINGKLIKQ